MKGKELTYSEVLIHLGNGGKIGCDGWPAYGWVHIANDQLVDEGGNTGFEMLGSADEYYVYIEPEWYDNIPDKGILCWVGDQSVYFKTHIRIITEYTANTLHNFSDGCTPWKSATPLTRDEITDLFLEAAPE